MNYVQEICDDLHSLFLVISFHFKSTLSTFFIDGQRFWQTNVWEADVSDERPDTEPFSSHEGWKKSFTACADAKRVCREVGVANLRAKISILFHYRSKSHLGTSEKFRNFSNTFTQRFQKKAPFFSWCWDSLPYFWAVIDLYMLELFMLNIVINDGQLSILLHQHPLYSLWGEVV